MSEEARPPRTGRFDALRVGPYRWLFFGGLFTFLTMQVSGIARAWLAYEVTGTNSGLGGVMMAFGLSSIVAIPSGGVLADRFSKRKILVAAGVMQTATPLVLGIVVATGSEAYWMLLAASLVQGAVLSILAPARLGYVAETVDRSMLTNAVFLSMGTVQFARVFGPAAAGALIGVAYFGLAGVFFVAAGTGVASVVLVLGLPPISPAHSGRSATGDLVDGLRFVRSRPEVLHLLVMSFGVVLLGFPHMAFLPVVAEEVYDAGPSGFGWLTTFGALGALVATVALANVQRRHLRPLQSHSALAFGATLVVFAVMPVFGLALAAFVLVGASSSSFQALNNSLLLTTVPVEYHGRIQSLLMLSFSGFAIAALPIGIVADEVGIRSTLVGLGVLVVAVMGIARLAEPRRPTEETAL